MRLLLYTLAEHTFFERGKNMPNYNRTEHIVRKLYTRIDVLYPEQLKINEIANKLGVAVRYWDFSSEAFTVNGKCFIVLNKNQSKGKVWEDFAHELSHPTLHVGRQEWLHVLFRQLQEYQANYFAYHFCVPTFMLEQLEEVSADVIVNLFNVEYEFAVRRLEMYQNKLLLRKVGHKIG